jgi:hypothetical protein
MHCHGKKEEVRRSYTLFNEDWNMNQTLSGKKRRREEKRRENQT